MSVTDDETKRRRRDGEDDDATGGGPDADSGDEGIEILEVEATDEAGVPIPEAEVEVEMEEDEPAKATAALAAEAETLRVRAAELETRASASESRAAELKEQLVRAMADFENFRKRTDRDRAEDRRTASAGLAKSLLPVLDNLSRALAQGAKAAEEAPVVGGFVEGVKLIETQLFDILKTAGLEAVDASGAFDPNVHEALMQEPSQTAPHMSVLEVYETGYKLGGRLLRPARVKVAWNPGEGESGEAS